MKFGDSTLSSHRHGLVILEQEYPEQWAEVQAAIAGVREQDIIAMLESIPLEDRPKSISVALNELFRVEFAKFDWLKESPIFQKADLKAKTGESNSDKWRLDFAKGDISIEVAFNHQEAIAWNLLKPVLASELNHVDKAVQTQVGVIICATEDLRLLGGFDNSVGTFEKFAKYLVPLRQVLSVPMVIIGLEGLETFRVEHTTIKRKKRARVILED
jgi:hypothetical protein